jgi:hypothetical protein
MCKWWKALRFSTLQFRLDAADNRKIVGGAVSTQ